MKLVECVPNFSEGRDPKVIDALVETVAAVDGARVLDVDPGADTNRTVLTFVGAPDAVVEGAFRLIERAAELIDMRRHHGAHPRHGAVDVCPFVPVSGVTMDNCAGLARQLGERVGGELGIPVYLYEHAASRPEWRNLATVRRGEYEALEQKLGDPAWQPDFGPAAWSERVARSGVVTIGAREFLIAYNINLATRDRRHAADIAFEIRDSGRTKRTATAGADYFRGQLVRFRPGKQQFPCGVCDEVAKSWEALVAHYRQAHDRGEDEILSPLIKDPSKLEAKPVFKPGMFQHCKATGWVIEDYGCAQITMNLTNYHVTPPHLVLEACREMARARGLVITGSEVVGVIPYEALLQAGRYYLRRHGGSTGVPWRDVLEIGVRSMGLGDVAPFDIDAKVIGLPERPADCLMARPVRDFVDEVCRESPAPGGGSVAALCGSIGAALACMVSNLTVNKQGFEAVWDELNELATRGEQIKERLSRSVDTDTEAFGAVVAAGRLPVKTAEQQAARKRALQEGYQHAARVPLETARLCLEALQIAARVVRIGNPPSVTDAGVAALVACAGVEGAIYNVRINLPSIADAAFRQEMERDLDALRSDARRLRDEVDGHVAEQLAPNAQ